MVEHSDAGAKEAGQPVKNQSPQEKTAINSKPVVAPVEQTLRANAVVTQQTVTDKQRRLEGLSVCFALIVFRPLCPRVQL